MEWEPQKVNILIVDDEPRNLMAIEAILANSSLIIVKANSGKEAIKQVNNYVFAVILLDVKMPDMDGFETATLIRKQDNSRNTPIIFLTAYERDELNVLKGYSLGAIDYMIKPINPEVLKTKVSIFVEVFRKQNLLQLQTKILEEKLQREKVALEKVNILIVDDSLEDLNTLEAILADMDQNIIKANSGKEALKEVLKSKFAIILMDVKMPDLDGFETAALIRKQDKSRDIPIIFLAEYEKDELNVLQEYSVGAVDFMIKPINAAILKIKVSVFVEVNRKQDLLQWKTKILEEKVIQERIAMDALSRVNRTEFYKDLLCHDVANFLQSIALTVEYSLTCLNNPEELKENLNNMQNQIGRAAKFISNVRIISTLEGTPPILESMEICSSLIKTIEAIKGSFNGREINSRLETLQKEIFIKADSLLIEVFENILHNAWQHNNNRVVEIEIKISKIQNETIDYIQIEIMDNGIGIPDNQKKGLFERLDMTRPSTKGRGLGLSLVKKIVTGYNGKIWVEDKIPGDSSKGSNFIIQLPEAI